MSGPTPGLVGSSADWLEISQRWADLATTAGHVLITGETRRREAPRRIGHRGLRG